MAVRGPAAAPPAPRSEGVGKPSSRSFVALAASTFAFAIGVAVWLMNGVLITFLDGAGIMEFDQVQLGWLIGAPVLTGALLRLPAGMITDRFGGRPVFTVLLLLAAVAAYLTSFADGFVELLLGGLGFGVAGATFAVGVAYVSLWFPANWQGTALGIFGAGNAGAVLTAMLGPALLAALTRQGTNLEGWRAFPRVYAAVTLLTAIAFWLVTQNRRPAQGAARRLVQRLQPLADVRVWRCGLYYFFAYGGFIALSQWLIPYYVNLYTMSLAAAGFMASFFSLPAAAVRIAGGWLADRFTPRTVLVASFGACLVLLPLLFPPRMDVQTPGPGITAKRSGVVREVGPTAVHVGGDAYYYDPTSAGTRVEFGPATAAEHPTALLPRSTLVQQPVVAVGDEVVAGQLLVQGTTHIYFQANVWVMTALVVLLAVAMGFAAGAVYAQIPGDFAGDVGTVGGIVGVLGALGGFVTPIAFGYLLQASGIWTSSWMFLFLLALAGLVWLQLSGRRSKTASRPG